MLPSIQKKPKELIFGYTEEQVSRFTDLTLYFGTAIFLYSVSPISTIVGATCGYFFGDKKIELLPSKDTSCSLIKNTKIRAATVATSLLGSMLSTSLTGISLGYLTCTYLKGKNQNNSETAQSSEKLRKRVSRLQAQ
jgi:hypothetical protein